MSALIVGQFLADEFLALLPAAEKVPSQANTALPATAKPAHVEALCNFAASEHPDLWGGAWAQRQTMLGPIGYPSQSEADMALCGVIAREAVRMGVPTGSLPETIWEVFAKSELHREEKAHQVRNYAIPKVIANAQVAYKTDQEKSALPRLDLNDGLIRFSDEPPPERDFVLDDLILAVKVCVLAGFGGTSKTQWLLQLAACIALGLPFMGRKTVEGAVLLLLGEEDLQEIARRFNAITKVMGLSSEQVSLLRRRIRAFPMVGLDMRLTRFMAGSLESTDFSAEIVTACKALENECGLPVRLVGVDHAGQIHGGEFNTREDVLQTMRQVSHMAQETGAAVLVLAHSPKSAAGSDKPEAAAVAGSTAWVDLARAVFVLRAMTDEEGKKLGIDPAVRSAYASFTCVKNNYGPIGDSSWLHRRSVEGYGVGVLQHVDIRPAIKGFVAADEALRQRIIKLLREKPNLTKYGLDGYARIDDRLKASKAEVARVREELLREGVLRYRAPTNDERIQLGINAQTSGLLTVAQEG